MKKLIWMYDTLSELKQFPEAVKDKMGFALHLAQANRMHPKAKPLKGDFFKGASTLEIVDDYDTNTYRCIYSVKLMNAVYVIHCFQKKSKQGSRTPKQELDKIKKRLTKLLSRTL